jgi:glycosyltransferase involved in cell wall biosynthesis
MNIFFIDPNNTTPRLNYPLVESLRREGVNITFLTAWHYQKTAYYDQVYNTQAHYIFFGWLNKIKQSSLRKICKLFIYPFTLSSILKLAKKEKPQLVHINWLIIPKMERIFIRKLQKMGIKVILTQHNYFQHDTKKLKAGEMAVFKTVDRIICLSKYVASQFPKELQNIIIQIEHGNCFVRELEELEIEDEKPSSGITAVFAGNLSYYKGLDLLIEAMALLRSKNQLPNLNIKIIGQGSGKYVAYLNNLIDKTRMQDHIEFENRFVSYRKLLSEIAQADFGLMTYRSATQSGLPYVFASFFKPLLVTEVGGLPEQVDKAFAQIVKPETASRAQGLLQLTQKIKTISKDNFAAFNANTKWQDTIEKYINNYRKLI